MSANFDAFASEWNALDRADRSRLRRLVRMGKPVDPEYAHLAPEYARFQMQRLWMRYFWFWFIPGMFLALGATATIHPLLVGVALALGGQAVWAYLSLRKAARQAT